MYCIVFGECWCDVDVCVFVRHFMLICFSFLFYFHPNSHFPLLNNFPHWCKSCLRDQAVDDAALLARIRWLWQIIISISWLFIWRFSFSLPLLEYWVFDNPFLLSQRLGIDWWCCVCMCLLERVFLPSLFWWALLSTLCISVSVLGVVIEGLICVWH